MIDGGEIVLMPWLVEDALVSSLAKISCNPFDA